MSRQVFKVPDGAKNVKYVEQDLTSDEQAQAIANLGLTDKLDGIDQDIDDIKDDLDDKLDKSLKGAASGLAELDEAGKVPSSQLPSYVDDVVECATKEDFPATGESGKIYIAVDTNLTYRWTGAAYVEISPSIALGETSSTAYRGDRGKTAYDHSQATHARTDATKTEASTTNGKIKINGTDTTVYTHPSHTAKTSGMYKITVDSEGHVSGTTAVTKTDITDLGIPGENTWRPLGTGATDACAGNDSRLSDSRTPKSHTHTKSQITDFPSSMPASDVYSWAKASTKPSYTYSEVGAAASSHSHSEYVPNKYNTRFYPFVCEGHGSNTYKITFPYSGATHSYAWFMTSFTLTVGAPYGNQPVAQAIVSWYPSRSNSTWVINKFSAQVIGSDLDNFKIWRDASNPAIMYLQTASNSGYSGFSITNLHAHDTAPSYDFTATTVESASVPDSAVAVTITQYLPTSGGTVSGDLVLTGTLYGSGNDYHNHCIELGHNGTNYVNFKEYGGEYYFYKSQSDSNTLLGKITANGWEGKVNGYDAITSANISSQSVYSATQSSRQAMSTAVQDDCVPASKCFAVFKTGATTATGNDGFIMAFDWGGGNYAAQIYVDTDPTGYMSVRQRGNDNKWTSWYDILTSNNISSYALPLSGGTLTGSLNLKPSSGNGCVNVYSSGTQAGYLNCNGSNIMEIGNARDSGWIQIANGNSSGGAGVIYRNGNYSPISALRFDTKTNSSRKFKDNIQPITEDRAKQILGLEVVTYDYKEDKEKDPHKRFNRTGVIAEDTELVCKEAVNYSVVDGIEEPTGVQYDVFIPYLIKMVQLQQKEIDELKSRLDTLAKEVK